MAQATAVGRINIVTGGHVTGIHNWPAQFRSREQNLMEPEGHPFRSGGQVVVLNSDGGQARFRLVDDVAGLVVQERPEFEPLRPVCEGLVDQRRA